jgi:transcriptional regulator with XRE-family HTH domain
MMTKEEKHIVQQFAFNMKACRESLGISQEKLAELATLHRTYIGSIERAEKIPSLITVIKIANALHVDVSQLTNNSVWEV